MEDKKEEMKIIFKELGKLYSELGDKLAKLQRMVEK